MKERPLSTQSTGYKAFIAQNLPPQPALVIEDNLKKLLVLADENSLS